MTGTASMVKVVRELPPLAADPGTTLHMLVVACSGVHCAGIDLETGALVRTWSPEPPQERIRPYDVVEVTVDPELDTVPDPAEPEGLPIGEAPHTVGRITGRRSERLIRPVLHPRNQPLLGVSSSLINFWERSAAHPSIAIVEPEGRVMMVRQGSYLGCRFVWQDHERELPCLDRAVAGHMDRNGRTRLTAAPGDRLVVALTAPIDGRCHKVVESLLRRS